MQAAIDFLQFDLETSGDEHFAEFRNHALVTQEADRGAPTAGSRPQKGVDGPNH